LNSQLCSDKWGISSEIITIPREVWFLPRPRKINKYKGGFPAYFEKKLFELYPSEKILQPFGGMAEYGIRVDINPEVHPDVVGDAHKLWLYFKDNTFDFVLCDPPYSTDLSGKLYHTGEINWKKYTSEAVRVCKPGGYIALYHWLLSPRPASTRYDRIIVVITRIRHFARICAVFQKTRKGEQCKAPIKQATMF